MKGFPAQFTDLSGETFFAENFKLFPKTPPQTAPLIQSKWREKYFCGEIWKTPSKLGPQFRVSRRGFWKVERIFQITLPKSQIISQVISRSTRKFSSKIYLLFARKVPSWLVGRLTEKFQKVFSFKSEKISQLVSREDFKGNFQNSFVQIEKIFPVD